MFLLDGQLTNSQRTFKAVSAIFKDKEEANSKEAEEV